MKKITTKHESLNDACGNGREFAGQHKTLNAAWNACERPDWLLWYAQRKMTVEKVVYVRVAIACAKRVLSIYKKRKPGDDRPRKAIAAALAWVENPSEENRQAASAAAAYAAAKKSEKLWQCRKIRELIAWQEPKANAGKKIDA